MIELTVKTLDSQNHSFSVEDDITVAQFKEKISETINIPADTQRIIYCGRVLKDDVKLSEYDVNGKVVHLVQRAPPTSNSTTNQPTSPQPQRRTVRNLEHGMFMGSMSFPQNIMDAPGFPQQQAHNLAASRLNTAKRMLRRAEAVLNLLENPNSRAAEQTPPPEEVQEEVTPVFEARVIVPNNSMNEPIDEVLSAVQNSLINGTAIPVNGGHTILLPDRTTGSSLAVTGSSNGAATTDEAIPGGSQDNTDVDSPPTESNSSTPEGASPPSTSTENLTADQRNGASGGSERPTISEHASRTTDMADLLDTLSRLQMRFAPFLEQYQNFMRQDPVVPSEEVRKIQPMINRVSEILHFLGHAYHSLSDIIVRVRTPPPRPLLCRPILIQHSVVQSGIPIQVEAQINISPEMATGNTETPPTSGESTNTTSTSFTTSQGPILSAQLPPHMLGVPIMPGAMHVQSFPIEIRSIHRPISVNINQNIDGSSNTSDAGGNNSGDTATSTATPSTTNAPITSTTTASGAQFTNPNVEFFMEVTPESITIDSLETTMLGTNQAGDVLRGALNGPPPEFIQSIMQMAGQIINRSTGQAAAAVAASSVVPTSSAPSSTPSTETTQTPQTSANANQTATGQNSQARGNTQTHPTTSTHTRSTARPHVHLAQHQMQGFDPFLPCNSHHVQFSSYGRRRPTNRNAPQQTNQNNNGRQEATVQANATLQASPLYNIVQGIVNSFHNMYRQRQTAQSTTPPTTEANTTTTTANTNTANPGTQSIPEGFPQLPFLRVSTFLPQMQNMNLSVLGNSPTIAQLLQHLPDETYVEGESIFMDLIMLLSRNLTLGDMMQLNNSRLEPLMRIRNEIRNFFLYQVLDGTTNLAAIDRGVNRFLTELQPFLDNLDRLPVRDDIDIVRSTQMLFRTRLPNIVSLAASRNPNSLRMLVDQCRITLRQLCALILHSSANGSQGVEEVLEYMVRRYMQGMHRDIENWTLAASRAQFRQFISTLSVPENILQPYIVRRIDSVTTPAADSAQPADDKTTEEPMELDEQGASGSSNDLGATGINLQDDTEPLPAVDIGSEPWHNQVPADWVPIIVRDTHRQRRQNSQPALSDAYLSGMPSKRRKIVTNSKPQGSLPQVIQESVRHAVTATGLTNVAPVDVVSQAAGGDVNIQSAYRELLRNSVQSTLQDNEDFTPERYPNATTYFNKPQ